MNYGHWMGLRGLATLLPLAAGVALVVLAPSEGDRGNLDLPRFRDIFGYPCT